MAIPHTTQQCRKFLHSLVQWSTSQLSAVHQCALCSAVHHCAVQYTTLMRNTPCYSAVHYIAVYYTTYNTLQCYKPCWTAYLVCVARYCTVTIIQSQYNPCCWIHLTEIDFDQNWYYNTAFVILIFIILVCYDFHNMSNMTHRQCYRTMEARERPLQKALASWWGFFLG